MLGGAEAAQAELSAGPLAWVQDLVLSSVGSQMWSSHNT